MRVLVTGATGYVGGRLIPRLLERGHEVRAMSRDPERVQDRPWSERVERVAGDLLRPETLSRAVAEVDAAYYLVHSMYGGDDFAEKDRRAAENFVRAAADVRHVVYLGGLVPDADDPSEHLSSRAEVGEVLRAGLPTTEFRAGPVIGSGSASFEMIRYLTERLPAMIAPRWILNEVPPIGIRDVLSYLVAALDRAPGRVVEIGARGMSFRKLMLGYAEARGLRRVIIPVPVLAPWLAARWVGLVTPIPNTLAVPLVEGLVHPLRADQAVARAEYPEIDPIPYAEAVQLALDRVEEGIVETRWSGSLGGAADHHLEDREGLIREVHAADSSAPKEVLFRSFSALGGTTGWLKWNWAWRLRGLLDRMVGGPGLRRGRRHPEELLTGEAVDFWRVEAVEPPNTLVLRAEMKVPGRAWLRFEAREGAGGEGSRLVQTALFQPRGLAGTAYWYLLYPIHRLIFRDMARAVAARAETLAGSS